MTGGLSKIPDLRRMAAKLRPKTVIIPGGDREEDLVVVRSLRQNGLGKRCILVGDPRQAREAAQKLGISIDPLDIVAAHNPDEIAATTIDLVRQGQADVILKGNISTPVLNRQILKLKNRETMSLVNLVQTPCIAGGRIWLLTDAGVTTVCNYSRMRAIILNAIDVARSVLDIERPRVAILSANEKIIPSLGSTLLAAALTEAPWDGATVFGPLSFDLAVDMDSVRLKMNDCDGPAAEVAGQADILVCPSLDAANILYKALMYWAYHGQASMAGVVVGCKAPYIILSRADMENTKIDSVALSCVFAEHAGGLAQPATQPMPLDKLAFVTAALDDGITIAAWKNGRRVDSLTVPGESALLAGLKSLCEDQGDLGAVLHWASALAEADDSRAQALLDGLAAELAKAAASMILMAGTYVESVALCPRLAACRYLADQLRRPLAPLAPIATKLEAAEMIAFARRS